MPQYLPKIGDKVTLTTMDKYTAIGMSANWQRLQVVGIERPAGSAPIVRLRRDGDSDATAVSVHLSWIQKPVYWPKFDGPFDQKCFPADAEKIWSWFKERNGVRVWGSMDLSCVGTTVTPGDREDKQHWRLEEVAHLTDSADLEIDVIEEVHTKPAKKVVKFKSEVTGKAIDVAWTYDKRHRDWFRYIPFTRDGKKLEYKEMQ